MDDCMVQSRAEAWGQCHHSNSGCSEVCCSHGWEQTKRSVTPPILRPPHSAVQFPCTVTRLFTHAVKQDHPMHLLFTAMVCSILQMCSTNCRNDNQILKSKMRTINKNDNQFFNYLFTSLFESTHGHSLKLVKYPCKKKIECSFFLIEWCPSGICWIMILW